MTFYNRVRELCEANGFPVSYLEQKIPDLNASPATISFWKRGSAPRTETVKKIADYFNVSPEYLLTGKSSHETFSASVEIGDGNVIGDNNTVMTCSEQEQAILDIFKSLDIYKQAELLLYAKKLQQETDK